VGSTSARLLRLVPGSGRQVSGLVGLLLLVTATYVGQGVLIARVLAAIFAGEPPTGVLAELGGIVALQLARAVLLAVREARSLEVSGAVKEAVRDALAAKLLQLGPGALQRTRTGAVQSAMVDGVELLDPLVGRFLPQVAASVLGAAAVTAYLVALDPLVGLVVLGSTLAAPAVAWGSERLIDARASAWTASYRRLYAENLDALQGMATLKAFNASRRWGAELDRRARDFSRNSERLMVAWCASSGGVGLAVAVGTVVSVALAALHRAQGSLTNAELFTILILAREAFRPFHDLQSAYHASYQALPASKGIFDLLDTEPEVAERTVPPGARPLASPPGLTFAGVGFTYSGRTRPALDGFSLEIAPGERVALVGRSGAGKTTVVTLLLGFFELQQGRIRVGGRDLRQLPLEELRALVGVVAQGTYLFHASVRDNLLLARPDAGQADLEAAAQAARAHEFISALPDGYDTVVGERGLKLSGGERQRIAIARALLKDAPILVLDEPTSSVDAANEALIQVALDELTRGRTTLVIAHRLSTVRNADRIVVMEAGRVTEAGEHASLLARGGAYARLVAAQAGVAR
jgi:ATP-binding cassette subfamily C protein CydD